MTEKIKAIDAWGTLIPPEGAKNWPQSFHHAFKNYKSDPRIFTGMSVEEMIDDMDEAGVDIVILSSFEYDGVEVISNAQVAEIVRKHPKRFVGCGTLDPRQKPMKALDQLKRMVDEHNMVCLRLEPYAYGDGMTGTPPNAKMYWPLYAKCCELDIAVSIQVGHTGPLLPSEAGRPIYLDEVALAFPDLRLIGAHLGQPWHEEMIILAWKHPNVYIETSARVPKHWPESFVKFANTYGQDKALWATDYPLLSFKRCIDEIEDLNMSFVAKKKLLRDNAIRAFKLEDKI